MSVEEWRPIEAFPGYDVSDLGRVRSRRGRNGFPNPYVMAPQVNPASGYLQMKFSPGRVFRKVHPLVLAAFVGPRPEGLVIRHLDGVKTNNRLTNLVYGTVAENNADTIRHGGHFQASQTACINGHDFDDDNTGWNAGKRVCRACQRDRYATKRGGLIPRISDEDAVRAVLRYRAGDSQRAIALELGVTQGLISMWSRGKARPHLQAELRRGERAA